MKKFKRPRVRTKVCSQCHVGYGAVGEDEPLTGLCPACVTMNAAVAVGALGKCEWCGRPINAARPNYTAASTALGAQVLYHEECHTKARKQQRAAVRVDPPRSWGDAEHRRSRPGNAAQ